MLMQPNSEGAFPYPRAADYGGVLFLVDSKVVLWKSVSALMQKHYGRENLTRLAKECKFGAATAVRLKEGKTSVGLEVIDKIAKQFNVQAWELLVPAFDPSNRPTLQPLSEQERRLYARLAEAVKEIREEDR
jgi:transcriptional regulator with XRE-family HTH domain